MKNILMLILLVFVLGELHAQYTGPMPGEMLPEISLKLIYPETKTITNISLRGKPVILIFISKGCMGAFQLLADADPLYKQYQDRINMIVIPIEDNDHTLEGYELYRKAYGLSFPVATDQNRQVHDKLGVHGMPHLIWLNTDGRINAITHIIRPAEVERFARGEALELSNLTERKSTDREFNRKQPLFVYDNGGADTAFFQRSLFSRWKPGMPNFTLNSDYTRLDPFKNLRKLEASGRRLKELYRIAYIGKSQAWQSDDSTAHGIYRYQPVLEIADSSMFMENPLTGMNLFCYSQVLPPGKRTRENMMQVMQADLKNCFGYEVTIETRRTPYWRLVAGKRAAQLLKAKSVYEPQYRDMMTGGKFYHSTLADVVLAINYAGQLIINDRPLIDETGITGVIDLQLTAAMTNLDDVRRALKAYDLDIIAGVRDMKVIVIRDPTVNK